MAYLRRSKPQLVPSIAAWQTYNRAYKAHHAKYMKKKMTATEFEVWSRYAVKLREKVSAGEIEFAEYYEKANAF